MSTLDASNGVTLLVIDNDSRRIVSVAAAIQTESPQLQVLMLDSDGKVAPAAALHQHYIRCGAALPNVVLVHANPRSWTAAAVLAVHRVARKVGLAKAMVVAEGPIETLPVLITDFPGLRWISLAGNVPAAVLSEVGAHAQHDRQSA